MTHPNAAWRRQVLALGNPLPYRLLVLTGVLTSPSVGRKHTTTDPACEYHRAPRSLWQRHRYDRARGHACTRCYPPRGLPLHLALHDEAQRVSETPKNPANG
jgi:hypothetical protein